MIIEFSIFCHFLSFPFYSVPFNTSFLPAPYHSVFPFLPHTFLPVVHIPPPLLLTSVASICHLPSFKSIFTFLSCQISDSAAIFFSTYHLSSSVHYLRPPTTLPPSSADSYLLINLSSPVTTQHFFTLAPALPRNTGLFPSILSAQMTGHGPEKSTAHLSPQVLPNPLSSSLHLLLVINLFRCCYVPNSNEGKLALDSS